MDKRIDERFRKPRRTKGTKAFVERNYWAAVILGGFSVIWFGLEFLPFIKKHKLSTLEKFKNSEEIETRQTLVQTGFANPVVGQLLQKVRDRAAYKNEPEPQSKFFKLLQELDKEPTGFTPDTEND